MPTKKSLEQRIKMQTYLNTDLSFKLTAWMKEKNISRLSQAITAILEHYLNDHLSSEISFQASSDEVETLKQEVVIIKASLVEIGAKSLASKMTTSDVIFPSQRMEIQYTDKEAQDGLTKSELCDRLGLTIYQAKKAAKEQGMNVNDYLLKVTGWKPSKRKRPRYYPNRN